MGQNIAIVILFILVIIGAYAFHKHKKDATAHKTILPPTTPAPIHQTPVGDGGTAGEKPPVEQK